MQLVTKQVLDHTEIVSKNQKKGFLTNVTI